MDNFFHFLCRPFLDFFDVFADFTPTSDAVAAVGSFASTVLVVIVVASLLGDDGGTVLVVVIVAALLILVDADVAPKGCCGPPPPEIDCVCKVAATGLEDITWALTVGALKVFEDAP